jgi:hypothetical protein
MRVKHSQLTVEVREVGQEELNGYYHVVGREKRAFAVPG